jgi:hypothetical protein
MTVLDTPHIGLLLDVLAKKAPKMCEAAQKELQDLKIEYCNEYMQNYCEVYGVPRGCEDWTDEELLVWTKDQIVAESRKS